MHGIGRYEGSITSTKLKVTGINLFSAGTSRATIVLADALDGVHKKLVIRDDKLVGACPETRPTAVGICG